MKEAVSQQPSHSVSNVCSSACISVSKAQKNLTSQRFRYLLSETKVAFQLCKRHTAEPLSTFLVKLQSSWAFLAMNWYKIIGYSHVFLISPKPACNFIAVNGQIREFCLIHCSSRAKAHPSDSLSLSPSGRSLLVWLSTTEVRFDPNLWQACVCTSLQRNDGSFRIWWNSAWWPAISCEPGGKEKMTIGRYDTPHHSHQCCGGPEGKVEPFCAILYATSKL